MGRTKASLVAAVLAVLLVTAGCLGGPGGAVGASVSGTNASAEATAVADADTDTDDGTTQTIRVDATGSETAQPDRAVLRVAVETTGKNASVARQRLAENVSGVRSALGEMDIDDGQVTTAYFDIGRDRRRTQEGEEVVFRGRHALTVTVTQPDRVGAVIVTAVENGATDVDDVDFTLSESTRRDLRRDALAEAVENARTKAETVASASESVPEGLTVRRVRTDAVDVRRTVEYAGRARVEAAAPTDIQGGSVDVTARVVITFNATG
jgi:uncharacterized protein YggE